MYKWIYIYAGVPKCHSNSFPSISHLASPSRSIPAALSSLSSLLPSQA